MKIGNLEVYGIIYKIENLINQKVYVGQTINGFDKRYCYKGEGIERVYKFYKSEQKQGKYLNGHLLNSIEKYGLDKFKVYKTFDIAFSKEELDSKEKAWISIYNATNPKHGYNNELGGSNGIPSKHSLITFSIGQIGFDIRKYKDFITSSYKDGNSSTWIADKIGTSSFTITKYLKKWGIEIRGNSEGKLGFDINEYKDDIINLYQIDKLTQKEISNKYNVSENVIKRLLTENNIYIRSGSETKLGLDIEKEKDYIIYMYTNKKLSMKIISEIINVDSCTLTRCFKKWNIEVRSLSEERLGFDINEFKEDIIESYVHKNANIQDISKIYNVNDCVIRKVLVENEIHIRDSSEIYLGFDINLEKNNIIDMYINNRLSAFEISNKLDNKISPSAVYKWLERWGIERRDQSETKRGKHTGKENLASVTVYMFDKEDNLINTFETKKLCAEWLYDKGIANSVRGALSGIDRAIKVNRYYKNKYKFVKEKNNVKQAV